MPAARHVPDDVDEIEARERIAEHRVQGYGREATRSRRCGYFERLDQQDRHAVARRQRFDRGRRLRLRGEIFPTFRGAPRERRHVSPARQRNDDRILGALAGVVTLERPAQARRLHAHDRVDLGIELRAALEHLANTPAERRIAILGTMAELGPDGPQYHREIGERADQLGIDVLVTVGEPALAIAEGFGGERYAVGTPEEARSILEELAAPGDRVLVKGSRSVGLERVLAG